MARDLFCHSLAAHFSRKPLLLLCSFYQSQKYPGNSFIDQYSQLLIPAQLLLFITTGTMNVNNGNNHQLASHCPLAALASCSTHSNKFPLFVITPSELDFHSTDEQSEVTQLIGTSLKATSPLDIQSKDAGFSNRMLLRQEMPVLGPVAVLPDKSSELSSDCQPSGFGKGAPSSSLFVSFSFCVFPPH